MKLKMAVIIFTLLGLVGAAMAGERAYPARVVRVVDGDTVDVVVELGDGLYREYRVRLAGIDAPERGQAGYQEAKDFLIKAIGGKEVDLVVITTKKGKWRRGKYGRVIGRIVCDGVDVGYALKHKSLVKKY